MLNIPPSQLLAMQLREKKIPFTAEYRFHPTRRWRADFIIHRTASPAPPALMVEVEGGGFLKGGGRHNRGKGFEEDMEKYAEATMMGFIVLRVTPRQILNNKAIGWILACIKQEVR